MKKRQATAKVAKSSSRGSKRGERRGGRKKGVPNRATADAREAIAAFVNVNAHRLQDWLDRIADGMPADDKRGIKAVPGDPEKAFSLFQSVIEYHVPKLARTEMTGKDGKDLEVPAVFNIIGVGGKK